MSHCKQCGEEIPADSFGDDAEYCSHECAEAHFAQPLKPRSPA